VAAAGYGGQQLAGPHNCWQQRARVTGAGRSWKGQANDISSEQELTVARKR